MGLSRYSFVGTISNGKSIASSTNMSRINAAVVSGNIECTTLILEESQRLDHIAGISYNDSSYWWVIAAASGIGWGLQVPPGTVLRIPVDLNKVIGLLA